MKGIGSGGAKGGSSGGVGESSIGRAIFEVRDSVRNAFDVTPIDNWAQEDIPRTDGQWALANRLEGYQGLGAWWYVRESMGVRCQTNTFISNLDLYGKAQEEKTAFSKVTMLTRTSKMGCFSWDLPAGPPKLGGTCPASSVGFDAARLGLDRNSSDAALLKAARNLIGSMDPSTEFAKDLASQSAERLRSRFICNGCYALKGNYWYISVALAMKWRKLWVDWALRTGLFVPHMVQMIREAQAIAARSRAAAADAFKRDIAPHPDFFRIHDAGDFFSRDYFFAWLEVVKALPNIWFWAPTRMWNTSSGADWIQQAARKGLPKNFALRPSTLFFDCPVPEIPGLAMGRTSGVKSNAGFAGGYPLASRILRQRACRWYMLNIDLPNQKDKNK